MLQDVHNTSVVPLLYYNECHWWLIIRFKQRTSLTNCIQLGYICQILFTNLEHIFCETTMRYLKLSSVSQILLRSPEITKGISSFFSSFCQHIQKDKKTKC
ncbi:hypothetical protein BRARA_I01798 [Brassica rapa]|uniref:Uncharacterized protein n=1 Tax=Brassica campestris TaxID=3711 RepID=A0A397XUQ9_BRACM|nr:hypothetical protein BRARA_I01798 [Brassica rapa]